MIEKNCGFEIPNFEIVSNNPSVSVSSSDVDVVNADGLTVAAKKYTVTEGDKETIVTVYENKKGGIL